MGLESAAASGKVMGGRVLAGLKQHAFSFGGVMSLGFAVMDARGRMKENPNTSTAGAIGGAAFSYAASELIPGYLAATMLYGVAKTAGDMAYQGYHNAPYVGFQKAGHFESVNLMDTAQTATMRQRSLAALNQSRMNARSVLGSEARMLHRNQVAY